MADRRVRLILEAQVDQFNRRMDEAGRRSEGLGRSLRDAVSRPEMQQLGRHLAAFGTATVGALGLATKAAMDWETAWTDVMRRTDGTPQQLNDLEGALRGVATELPTTHQEVAAVAAAATQLGVGVDDVEDFTRVMIDMGVSTNMSAEEAATAMQRLANVMGTPTEEMRNLGSAVVDLGNNSATTESEIMDMAQRIAGAGTAFGMSEGEVLGFAAALTSVGIPAAAGGTAVSRMMYDINNAVSEGGEALEGFADVAGMTADEFNNLWQEDSASALEAFVVGLQRASEEGTSVQETLANLGITEQRTIMAFTNLAAAGDDLSDAMARGNSAFEEGTALGAEAAHVYGTLASQIKAFWSNVKDAAIELGQHLAPALEWVVEKLNAAVTWFAELPGPIQASIAGVAALTGGLALLAGGLIILAPSLLATSTALGSLGLTAPRMSGVLGGIGRVAQGAALGFIAMEVGVMAARLAMSDFEHTALDAEKAIENGTVAALEFEGNAWGVGRGFDGMGEAIARTTDLNPAESMAEWGADALGLENSLTHARDAVANFDTVLAEMIAKGDLEGAAEGFRQILEEANDAGVATTVAADEFNHLEGALHEAGISMDEFLVAIGASKGVFDEATGTYEHSSLTLADLRDRMSESEEEALAAAMGVEELDDAMMGADEGAGQLEAALEEVGLAADGTVESLSAFLDILFETGILTMSARDAAARFNESLDAADQAVQTIIDSQGEMGRTLNQSKTDFDLTTEAGRLANSTFQDITRSGFDSATAMAEAGASQDEIQGKLGNTYDSLVTAAQGFGLSEEAAVALTREVMGIPDDVSIESWMSEEAKRVADETNAALDRVDGRKTFSEHLHTIRENRVSAGSGIGSGAGGLFKATGGAVHGPGTGTSDSIAAYLSNGEHVLTAREVSLMGGQGAVYDFRRSLNQGPSGRDMRPAYAAGGAVQARQISEAVRSGVSGVGGGGPSELTGTLYMENGAMLGQVRMAMKDPSVVRTASQSLAQQGRRDRRAG